ncbi:MAG: hypothetical protein AB7E04_12870 [Desulfobacteraceae bacterium]
MKQKWNKNLYMRNWLAEVRALVGDGYLQKTFGSRHMDSWKRTARHWTKRIDHEAEPRRNPIEVLSILLEYLKSQPGGRELAFKYAVLIAEICGGEFTPRQKFKPEKSIEEECLEDYPEIVAMHSLIKHEASIEEIEYQANEVTREIDETVFTVKHNREK